MFENFVDKFNELVLYDFSPSGVSGVSGTI
jgi:hypothetical protein